MLPDIYGRTWKQGKSEPFKDLQDSLLSRLLIAGPCLLLQAPRAQVLAAWTHSSWGPVNL